MVRLDPKDPTPWLYRALVKRQANRLNGALGDLRESAARNQNRQLFHSRMLLNQDRAVPRANLARVYHELGYHKLGLSQV